jgi:hypothetical protein
MKMVSPSGCTAYEVTLSLPENGRGEGTLFQDQALLGLDDIHGRLFSVPAVDIAAKDCSFVLKLCFSAYSCMSAVAAKV